MFSTTLPLPLLINRYHPLPSPSPTAPPRVTLRDDGTLLAKESLPPELVAELMPNHVAVIMDGHGRWAKPRGLAATEGHRAGVESLTRMVMLCCSWGIEVLTVFACSTENLARPKVVGVFLFRICMRFLNLVIGLFGFAE